MVRPLSFINLLAFRQEIFRVTLAGRRDRNRIAHNALLVDDHGGSVGDSFIREKRAVLSRHLALRMKILQERKRYSAQRLCPVIVGKSAVDAHTQHLGVTGLKLALHRFESRHFLASSRRPIQRIEHQHDVFPTFELTQGKLGSSQVARQFEVGSLLSNSDHYDFSSKKIKRSNERSRFKIITDERISMRRARRDQ